ncbi:hypothetical protein BDW67DRAFT_162613 [Aspergillus spinulosporus]
MFRPHNLSCWDRTYIARSFVTLRLLGSYAKRACKLLDPSPIWMLLFRSNLAGNPCRCCLHWSRARAKLLIIFSYSSSILAPPS